MKKKGSLKNQHGKGEKPHENEDGSASSRHISLRYLSKVILPPLGASNTNYNQNQAESEGLIISPLDSRYRSVLRHFLVS